MRIVFLLPYNSRIKKAVQILLLFCAAALLLPSVWSYGYPVVRPGLPLAGKTIVVDPGHGGYDPGVFRGELEEKEITLAISLILRDYLQGGGARVVMTREADYDLLTLEVAGTKKTEEMRQRKELINAAEPDLLISIHVNAISSSRWSGAQVFYNKDCDNGKRLAESIQDELARVLKNTDRMAKAGNYFMLKETEAPLAALVETGFLSNPKEASLLAQKHYQNRVAWAVYLGITRYFVTATEN